MQRQELLTTLVLLRGNAYLDQRRFHLAIDDYTRALELTPDDPIAYTWYAD